MPVYIFRSTGHYVGFVQNDQFFSRDGVYLGWVEREDVWDRTGQFQGKIKEISGNKYIVRNIYVLSPIPRMPRAYPASPNIPPPPSNVPPINLPIGDKDAF